MNNTDLFEKPFYTVTTNGLFGITTKASVTNKITGPGLMEQVREGNHIPYENLTLGRLEEVVNEVFAPERRMIFHTGPAGMVQFERAMQDSFRDQLITGSSTIGVNTDTLASTTTFSTSNGTYIAGIDPYDSDGTVTIGYIDAPIVDNRTRSIQNSIVQGTNLMERMVPYQRHYDIVRSRLDQLVGEERDRQHETSDSLEVIKRRLLDEAQRQLQRGEISAMDYLDLISRQQ